MAQHELALDGDGIERNISDLVESVKSDASLKKRYFKVAWKCPVCDEAMCVKFGNKDSIRTGKEPHFCHKDGASPLADHEPETERHRNAKRYFKDVFADQLSDMFERGEISSFDGPKTEVPLCNGKSRADVYFSFVRNDGTRVEYAIEIQYSPIDPSGFEHRHRTYESHGVRDIWIMGKDFLGSRGGSYVKPAGIIQILFDTFGYVSFFDIEEKRAYHAFALPEKRRVEFPLGPKSPTYQTYMYCPEMAPEKCRFREGRCVYVGWDGDDSLENHIRLVESHVCGPGYIDIMVAGQDAAVPSYRLDDGVPYVRSRLSDLSKARFEKEFAKKEKAYNDALEIERKRRAEFSSRASSISSGLAANGQLGLIYASLRLGTFLRRLCKDIWKGDEATMIAYVRNFCGPKIENDALSYFEELLSTLSPTFKNWEGGRAKSVAFAGGYLELLSHFVKSEGCFRIGEPTLESFRKQTMCAMEGSWRHLGGTPEVLRETNLVFGHMEGLLDECIGFHCSPEHLKSECMPLLGKFRRNPKSLSEELFELSVQDSERDRVRSHMGEVTKIFEIRNPLN